MLRLRVIFIRVCPQQAQDPNLYVYYCPIIISIPKCVLEAMPFAVHLLHSESDSSTTVIVVAVFVALICLGFLCVRRFVRPDAVQQAISRRIRDNEFLIMEAFIGHRALPLSSRVRLHRPGACGEEQKEPCDGIPVALPVPEKTHALLQEEVEEAPLADSGKAQTELCQHQPERHTAYSILPALGAFLSRFMRLRYVLVLCPIGST